MKRKRPQLFTAAKERAKKCRQIGKIARPQVKISEDDISKIEI